MKLTKFITFLIGIFFLFSACSFEDEIEIDPGKFIVHNNSGSSYDLVIENMQQKGTVDAIELTIGTNTSMNIPLNKGYSYEVKAVEVNPNNTELKVYSTIITIEAHQDSEWIIPAN